MSTLRIFFFLKICNIATIGYNFIEVTEKEWQKKVPRISMEFSQYLMMMVIKVNPIWYQFVIAMITRYLWQWSFTRNFDRSIVKWHTFPQRRFASTRTRFPAWTSTFAFLFYWIIMRWSFMWIFHSFLLLFLLLLCRNCRTMTWMQK